MSGPKCVNLLETFGDRFRVTFDPAYLHKGVRRRSLDPWYMQLPCRGRGVMIYPFGGSLLCIEVDGRPKLLKKLLESGVCELHQEGDAEHTLLVDLEHAETVFEIVRPIRRRHHCDQERQLRAARLALVRP
jgi:hypothetical protein